MGYQLGVDLGTTWTAAAVARDGRVEIASLGNHTAAVPSVIFVRDDESILVGEAAERRGLSEPDRVVREFKRRFGDPTPILIGGAPFAADGLVAKLLRWVIDRVAAREAGPPDRIAVTHPANWGPYKLDLLAQAVRMADVADAVMISEPEAAAISYAANERMEVGETVAVYDLGGGTFDAAVLRKTAEGFEVLGRPDGIERLGGIDFDEAVFVHVAGALGATALENLDPDDPASRAAVARLRVECIEAKEALSSDTDVVIPVMLPPVQTEVRLTRGEFESLIRPALSPTVDALSRTLSSAALL
ncbi:MAG: molecular chaperone DnaK, partial [Actinomycetota bacterium]|nr:molecular chaperone DnaK [Actinomycetota bacterium]